MSAAQFFADAVTFAGWSLATWFFIGWVSARRRATDLAAVPAHWHPAVELRISTPYGPVMIADSETLHYIAKYGLNPTECGPACLPGCRAHGWTELFPGDVPYAHPYAVTGRDFVIEARPVMLPCQVSSLLSVVAGLDEDDEP